MRGYLTHDLSRQRAPLIGAHQIGVELLALRPADGKIIVGQGVAGAAHVGGVGDQIKIAACPQMRGHALASCPW